MKRSSFPLMPWADRPRALPWAVRTTLSGSNTAIRPEGPVLSAQGKALGFLGIVVLFLVLVSSARADAPHPSDAEARTKMQDILARKEYVAAREPEEKEPQQGGASVIGVPAVLGYTLIALFTGLLLGVILFFLIRLTRYVREGQDRNFAAEQEAARKQLSRQYRQEALDRAGKGEYTEAIRYLFLSLVFLFDESGRVLFQRAYTNREYLTLFDERPAVRGDLRVFVDLLDDRWYGQHMSSEQQFQHCQTLYDKLQQGA